jgi:predicted MFS family arabinose efflux permease
VLDILVMPLFAGIRMDAALRRNQPPETPRRTPINGGANPFARFFPTGGHLMAGQPTTRLRITRDRTTISLFAFFCAFGWFMLGFSPAVPLIAAELQISNGVAALLGPALAGGMLGGALLISPVTAWLGRRRVFFIASLILTIGLFGLFISTAFNTTLVATFVAALGAESIAASLLPGLAIHHGPAAPAALSEGAALAAIAGLVAPLAVGFSVSSGIGWQVGVGCTVVLLAIANGLLATVRGGTTLDGRKPTPEARESGSGRFTPQFWLIWVACISGIALEFSILFWVPALFAERAGMDLAVATSAASALVLGELVSRFAASRLSLHLPVRSLLFIAFGVTALGWLTLWLATVPWLAIAGLFVAGLGIGPLQPLTASTLYLKATGRETVAQARVSIAQALAIGVFPFVLGGMSDVVGTFYAFLVIPVLVLLGAATVAVGTRADAAQVATLTPEVSSGEVR